jgi:hypothetical protein
MKNVIINQSQQGAPEVIITEPIARLLYQQLQADGVVASFYVPLLNRHGNDLTMLYESISVANGFYDSIQDIHDDICQVDIHANANDGNSYGCSTYYISDKGYQLATSVFKSLSEFTPTTDNVGINKNSTFATLKRSKAICTICECSFYDESIQKRWMLNNAFEIASCIRRGIYNYFGIGGKSYSDNISLLANCGVINSPAYWITENNFSNTYFVSLIKKATLYSAKPNFDLSWEYCINYWYNSGVINSYVYWTQANEFKKEYMKRFINNVCDYLRK